MNSDNCKSAKEIAIEFWCGDHLCREPDGVMKDTCSRIICWRTGWALGVHSILKKNGVDCQVLHFFKNIESGDRWQRGCKSSHLADGSKRKQCVKIYDPIVFKHAAWLLGWFDGYMEIDEDALKKYNECRVKGYGTGKGKSAANLYLYKLCERNWINNSEVKRLLGIPVDM